MSEARTIAIGDIHGCVLALDTVLEDICPTSDDHLVILGDVVDFGRESALVLDRLIDLAGACRLTCILGNHEEMMLTALENESARMSWLECGGFATLNSYRFGGKIDVIPDDHIEFVRGFIDYYETDQYLFFHANYEPALTPDEQPPYVSRWGLLGDTPPDPHISGKTVFVGHTEQTNGEIRDCGHLVCIDTACWRYGWLTALEVTTRQVWQASRFGVRREQPSPQEPSPEDGELGSVSRDS